MSHYPHLFAPIRVRNVYIKNRIESAPMSASGERRMKCMIPLLGAAPVL